VSIKFMAVAKGYTMHGVERSDHATDVGTIVFRDVSNQFSNKGV